MNRRTGAKFEVERGDTRYLTREQLAARYQVCVRTIDYWRDDGVIPAYKLGRFIRFRADECDTALRCFRRKSRWEAVASAEGGNPIPVDTDRR